MSPPKSVTIDRSNEPAIMFQSADDQAGIVPFYISFKRTCRVRDIQYIQYDYSVQHQPHSATIIFKAVSLLLRLTAICNAIQPAVIY